MAEPDVAAIRRALLHCAEHDAPGAEAAEAALDALVACAVEPDVLRLLLLYATRYALARSTSALDDAAHALALYGHVLCAEDVRGIRDYAALSLRLCTGERRHEYDRVAVTRVGQWAENELGRRSEGGV